MTHKKITIDGIDYELIPVTKEVVQKEWEIVSFIQTKSFEGEIISPYNYVLKDNLYEDAFGNTYRENELLKHRDLVIHSVKRLSDKEVFSVGDDIIWNEVNHGRIKSFEISPRNNGMIAKYYEHHGVNIMNIIKSEKFKPATTFQWADELVKEVIGEYEEFIQSLIVSEIPNGKVKKFEDSFITNLIKDFKASKQLNTTKEETRLDKIINDNYEFQKEYPSQSERELPTYNISPTANRIFEDTLKEMYPKETEKFSSQPQNNKESVFDENKLNERYAQLTEKKYTEEDIKKAFEAGREFHPIASNLEKLAWQAKMSYNFSTFEDYKNYLHKS